MNIQIQGARTNNLKSITVEIPRNRLVVVTGLSGSGKSSLVFGTIAAAAQREYFDSLSSYARRSLPRFPAPDVDAISALSPCIIIDQRPVGQNIRSTVGTITETYTLLRLLYSRLGHPIVRASALSFNTPEGACETCAGLGVQLVPNVDQLVDFTKSLAEGAIQHRAWKVGSRYWNIINASGMFDMNLPVGKFDSTSRDLLLLSDPKVLENVAPGYVQTFSFEGLIPRLLKRQNDKRGLETGDYDQSFFTVGPCESCRGSRLNGKARSVLVQGRNLADLLAFELPALQEHVQTLIGPVADAIVPQLTKVLRYLIHSGVGYLTLGRPVNTLSGGESQRVKLSRQLGSSLTEMIYVLDEPTVGLHPRDVDRLGDLLLDLRARPNTVLVVEHDCSIIRRADHIIELGPGAGAGGGNVIAAGSPVQVAAQPTPTGRLLAGQDHAIEPREARRRSGSGSFNVIHAHLNNLKDLEVQIPQRVLVCISGVSGSGKTSLIKVLLSRYPEIIAVDQSPIGRSSRSIVATYVGAFDQIRAAFAAASHLDPSFFAFNSSGACEACGGLGVVSMDMHFLGDVDMPCEECEGNRYKPEVLSHRLKGATIAEVLNMTVDEGAAFFSLPDIRSRLSLLSEVGLGYLRLGESLDSLSGGELQRAKLASRIHRRGFAYCLDEPTRGLHFDDVKKLIALFGRLVSAGNSVIVVEHDLSVLAAADWIIDMGPGGGESGGRVVAQGTPVQITQAPDSETGRYLARQIAGKSLTVEQGNRAV